MKVIFLVVPFLLAIWLCKTILPYIILITYKKRLFDPINDRKVHARSIPRLGGVAFMPIQLFLLIISIVVAYKVNYVPLGINREEVFPMIAGLCCGLFLLYMVGIADDMIGVNHKTKFVVQILAASIFPLTGLWINDLYGLGFIVTLPIWIGVPLTIFLVVLIINAINLIDGLDGLCSGVVMVGCAVLGVLFAYDGAWLHALFAFITAGVLISFFYYNVFGKSKGRHKIFMGDTGSMTLGYSIAFLAISFAMNNKGIKPFYEGAIVVAFSTLIVPILDVARVMFVRWYSGKPIFQPDRNHLHHKFLRTGMPHGAAMLCVLSLALFFCTFNMIAVHYLSNNIVLVANGVLWIGFHYVFNRLERKNFSRLRKMAAFFF